MLRHSRRFGEGSGIGQLARLVNRQESHAARKLLALPPPDVNGLSLKNEQDRAFDRLLLDGLNRGAEGPQGYRSYLRTLGRYRPAPGTAYDDPLWEQWASKVLHGFEDFQLLCAVRRGAWAAISQISRKN